MMAHRVDKVTQKPDTGCLVNPQAKPGEMAAVKSGTEITEALWQLKHALLTSR